MFQIMTLASMEPVAKRKESAGEQDTQNEIRDIKLCAGNVIKGSDTQVYYIMRQMVNKLSFTNLFHSAADVHTCHSVLVTLEVSL